MQASASRVGAGDRRGTWIGGLVGLWAALASLPAPAPAPAQTQAPAATAAVEGSIEEAFRSHAPAWIRTLKDRGIRNVGVLKFRVQRGDAPVRDDAGPLCIGLADKLTVALVLGNDLRDPVGIVRDADATAAAIPGADHLSPQGRKPLFSRPYRLAWGQAEVVPDALLTGVAVLEPGYRKGTLAILMIRRDGTSMEKLDQLSVATDARTVGAAGGSFLLRAAFEGGRLKKAEDPASDPAWQVDAAIVGPRVLDDPTAPVGLTIRYDGKPVPFRYGEGSTEAVVPEPREDQEVTFTITKRDAKPVRYGVVLFVNGVNTLDRQRCEPAMCGKWILEPTHRETQILGFQEGNKAAERFRVLSRPESERDVMHYGRDGGTVSFFVFGEAGASESSSPSPSPSPSPRRVKELPPDLALITRGVLPTGPAETLAALRYRLDTESRGGATRGLIGFGDRVAFETREVAFRAEPRPLLSATIRYYHP
jgi:hypothetical protein